MIRNSVTPAALLLLLGGINAEAQRRCSDGSEPFGVIGIGWYHCVGGICRVDERPATRRLEFTTEPRLRDIAQGVGIGDPLMDGDVLAAIDGTPITLPAAGRQLGRLAIGDTVRLTVRRAGIAREIVVVAVAGCSLGLLAVTPDTTHPGRRPLRLRSPSLSAGNPARLGSGRLEYLKLRDNPGSFGIAISCGRCGWESGSRGEHRWRAHEALRVTSVDAGGPGDRAGIRVGDTITRINDLRIDSVEGAALLTDVRAGGVYRLGGLRSERPITFDIRAVPAG